MNLIFIGLGKSYNGKTVFENISGEINSEDKIGLVGVNGRGKTTLAKILSGLEAYDVGKIRRSPAYSKSLYVEQYPLFDVNVSVYDEIFRVASNNQNTIKDYKTFVKKALHKVGLGENKWGQKAVSLSGGEKTKLALCRAMVSDFDLLILDEPTNHLDMKSYAWLEEFVQNLGKPMLLISHDRFFLDHVASKIWELTDQGLKAYEGNYSAYKRQKEIELTSIMRDYDKQQAKIQNLKRIINERENWFKSAHKAAGQTYLIGCQFACIR
ncbi:ATP-binding cassette domain-containing protein [Desulforamulus reducens]|uniref:ATP-binding cassette domain-containing protein n=1 Tax=Desulforamulus reducens TaxID=59610 RepID=UPI00006BA4C8|nr:ATP-binding cassette domain-containing protein [Desulforamulus reducens]